MAYPSLLFGETRDYRRRRNHGIVESKKGLKKLDDGQIEDVAGGYTHLAESFFGSYSIYEVIDDESGDVLATFDGPDSYSQARAKAEELGMTPDGITDNQLSALRYRYKKGK